MLGDTGHVGWSETYWERVARTRWGAYMSHVEERALRKAHELSERPTAALDVGAEGWRWSKMLADLGWKMTCTDTDAGALAVCGRRVPTASCVLVGRDERRLPCMSESMGLLLCIEVPPVIQADWFVRESSRVLQNGGLLVGVFWNRTSLRGFAAHCKSRIKGAYDYYRLPYPAWRRMLVRSGYSILHEEGCCWGPFSRTSDSVLVPSFVRTEERLRLRKLPLTSPWIVFIAQKSKCV